VCVREREREIGGYHQESRTCVPRLVSVCERERKRERESVCVCVCVT